MKSNKSGQFDKMDYYHEAFNANEENNYVTFKENYSNF